MSTDHQETIRNTAGFHSTLWGNQFLASDFKTIDTTTHEKHEKLKREVRRMIEDKSVKKLELIDTVQRLGVAYHFEEEIKDELHKIFHCHADFDCVNDNDNGDLNTVSLRFRLLRQQGINISCAVFEKFKDEEGKFKVNDVQAMLSLYEAAHLGIRGEDILDGAIDFTTTHLKSMISDDHVISPDNNHLADQLSHALYCPRRKRLPRLEARYFLSIYPRCDFHNETLLDFAVLDFNMVQSVHQKELSDLTQWCKDIDFVTKVPYARDRLVELYFWMSGVYFEPQYAFGRRILVKVLYMITIIDDTIDSYGTIEEVKLFTEAIKRWNMSAIDILPEYMKVIYKTLLDVYEEIEQELTKQGRLYCLNHAIQEMQKVVEAYFVEANWFNEGYVPTVGEYISVAHVSICYSILTIVSFIGLDGDIATKEAFEWASNYPKIIRGSAIISRLMEDKASHKFEQKRGHVASSVECYMKQHGVCEEEVIKLFLKEIENGWKDMNEELLKLSSVPRPLLEPILNLLRAAEFVYKEGDSFTNSYLMKDHISSLLRDPVLI